MLSLLDYPYNCGENGRKHTIAYTYLSYHHLRHRCIYKPLQPLVLPEEEWKWNSVVGSAADSLPSSHSTERNRSSTRLPSRKVLNSNRKCTWLSSVSFPLRTSGATPCGPFHYEYKKIKGLPHAFRAFHSVP